jgi:hypothetical protein
MKELDDGRDEKNILRSIQRMVAGDIRFSGEMRALLGLMEQTGRKVSAWSRAPKAKPKPAAAP